MINPFTRLYWLENIKELRLNLILKCTYQKSIASPPFIPALNMLTFPFIFLSRKKKFRRRVVASTPRSLCSLKHGIKYYKWILVHVENELEKEKAAKVSLAEIHRSMQQVATVEKAFLKLDSLGASGKILVPPFCLVFHLNSFPRYLSKSFCLYRVLGKYCPISILAHVSIYVVLSVVSSRENLCAQNILYACTFQIVHRNPAIVCLWWFYSYCIQTFIL